MAGLDSRFEMSIKSNLNGFLQQMLRSTVVKITSWVYTKTIVRLLLGRILAGCYWFCILIWVSTYTANLAAFFTVKNSQHGINNLEDVIRSSYKVGILEKTFIEDFFEASEHDQHRKIWHQIQAGNSKFKNTSQAVQWVRETEESLFINEDPILSLANQPPCDLLSGK